MTSKSPQQAEKGMLSVGMLLNMKLNIPVINKKVTMRRRLGDKLNGGLTDRLTLVTAPAGFGKTTAVVAWLMQKNIQAAWFSIDSGDNNLKRFWSYIIAAFDTIRPGIKNSFSQYLYATNTVIIEDVVTALIDELSQIEDEFVLVLDDYQFIDDIPIHASIALLIKYLPPNAHIVVISRTRPPFCKALLQTIGKIKEIGITDLKFNTEEIQKFCRDNGKHMSKSDLLALESHTNGWAVGLCVVTDLAGHNLDCPQLSSIDNRDSHCIDSYLTEESMNRWNSENKEFLLRTSILPSLTGPLCDALTGNTDGKQRLKKLSENSSFIIPLDEEGVWYRYHHILSEYLQKMLESSEDTLVYTLHDRAGEWCERNGYLPEAVTHFLLNENYDRASDLIETLGIEMLKSGEYSTLLDWLGSLPKLAMKNRDMLCLIYAWALLVTDSVDEATPWINAVEARDEKRALNESEEQWEKQLQGEIAALKAFMGFKHNDPQATLLYLTQFKSYGLEQSMFGSKGLNINKGEASLLAGMFGIKGELTLLEQRFSAIYEITREIQINHFGYVPVLTGEIFFERNEIEAAVTFLEKGMKEAEDSNTSSSFVPAVIAMAKVMVCRGDINGAYEIIRDGVNRLRTMGGIHLLPLISAFRARLSVLTLDIKAAEEWTQKNCLGIYDPPSLQRMYEQITLVRVLLSKKEYDSCILLLYKLLYFVEKEQYLVYIIELLNLSAILYSSLGQTQKAMDMLQKSLTLGEKEKYERIFVEEGVPMVALLERFLKYHIVQEADNECSISPNYIRNLIKQTKNFCITISAFAKPSENDSEEMRSVQPLTKREKDVLRLLGFECSNAEIAITLNMALNTVKVNCSNIYRKLNVKNREQAVNVAREKKLLD